MRTPDRGPAPADSWRTLPPIHRALGPTPLTNPVQRFSATLTSWHDPSSLAPLGHAVSPTGPAGLIDTTPTAGGAAAPGDDAHPGLPVAPASPPHRNPVSAAFSTVASFVQRLTGTAPAAAPPAPPGRPSFPGTTPAGPAASAAPGGTGTADDRAQPTDLPLAPVTVSRSQASAAPGALSAALSGGPSTTVDGPAALSGPAPVDASTSSTSSTSQPSSGSPDSSDVPDLAATSGTPAGGGTVDYGDAGSDDVAPTLGTGTPLIDGAHLDPPTDPAPTAPATSGAPDTSGGSPDLPPVQRSVAGGSGTSGVSRRLGLGAPMLSGPGESSSSSTGHPAALTSSSGTSVSGTSVGGASGGGAPVTAQTFVPGGGTPVRPSLGLAAPLAPGESAVPAFRGGAAGQGSGDTGQAGGAADQRGATPGAESLPLIGDRAIQRSVDTGSGAPSGGGPDPVEAADLPLTDRTGTPAPTGTGGPVPDTGSTGVTGASDVSSFSGTSGSVGVGGSPLPTGALEAAAPVVPVSNAHPAAGPPVVARLIGDRPLPLYAASRAHPSDSPAPGTGTSDLTDLTGLTGGTTSGDLGGTAGTGGSTDVFGSGGSGGWADGSGAGEGFGEAGGSGWVDGDAAGVSGWAGTTGMTGTAWSDGSGGSSGLGGSAGYSGSAGLTGLAGSTGSTAAGWTGSAGSDGMAGSAGSAGSVGLAGSAGSAGLAGLAGSAGMPVQRVVWDRSDGAAGSGSAAGIADGSGSAFGSAAESGPGSASGSGFGSASGSGFGSAVGSGLGSAGELALGGASGDASGGAVGSGWGGAGTSSSVTGPSGAGSAGASGSGSAGGGLPFAAGVSGFPALQRVAQGMPAYGGNGFPAAGGAGLPTGLGSGAGPAGVGSGAGTPAGLASGAGMPMVQRAAGGLPVSVRGPLPVAAADAGMTVSRVAEAQAPAAETVVPIPVVAGGPGLVAATVVQRADAPVADGGSATSTAPPAPAASGAGEPDELLKKLFDPLLRRIKAELRLDRDRRGTLTDLSR